MLLTHIVVLLIYFLIVIAIGYVASRRTHNTADYVLGGRIFNPYITALGAGASDMGSWLLLGLPGAVYLNGINHIWLPIGLTLGAFVNWTYVAKRLRVYSELARDSLTLPLYLSNRFLDRSGILRMSMAIIALIFFTVYISSGLAGFALLFQVIFHLHYYVGLWIGLGSIVIYTLMGGFIAVNWIDFFQGSLMLFALIILPIVIGFHLFDHHHHFNLDARLAMVHLGNLNPFNNVTTLSIISLLGWGLGYFGQPHILVRFMASRKPQYMDTARNVCMTWMILCLAGAIFVGLFGAAYYAHEPLMRPETVFLRTSVSLFSPIVSGILLSALLSAIMSTIAAQLLVCSSALIEDIYEKLFDKDLAPKRELFFNRIAVILVAIVALFLALDPKNTVLKLVSYAWAGLGAAFGPTVLLSLYWKKMTRNAAVIGILLGGLTVLIWESLANVGGIMKLYSLIPGFLVSTVAIVVVSLSESKHHRLNHRVLGQHDNFVEEMKKY